MVLLILESVLRLSSRASTPKGFTLFFLKSFVKTSERLYVGDLISISIFKTRRSPR